MKAGRTTRLYVDPTVAAEGVNLTSSNRTRGQRMAKKGGAAANRGRTYTSKREVTQVVKSLIGQTLEHKRANIILNGTAAPAGEVLSLSQFVVEGDGISQRTGRVINLVMIDMRIRRTLNTLTNKTSCVRMIVFLDTQNQGVFPAVTDVLTSANVVSAYEVNNAQQHRFRILRDEIETLCDGGANNQKASSWRFRHKCQIHYGGAADAAASNRKNAVFFLILTNNTVAGPDWSLGVGLDFTDA